MSRVAISDNGSLIFYIEDYTIGSTGYAIDYRKGDSSKWISAQCKVKVVDYMILGTEENSKKYMINLYRKYSKKNHKFFTINYVGYSIGVLVQYISDWEFDIFTKNEIIHMILYGEIKSMCDPNEIIKFNDDWKTCKK